MDAPAQNATILLSAGILLLGGVACVIATAQLRRLIAIALVFLGAGMAVSALRAPPILVFACAAAAFAWVVAGATLIVRLSEGYGSTDGREIEAADRVDDAAEFKP
jgi:energy-converting hydrogenase Eha subunit C